MEKEEIIEQIINGIANFKIIPFFGAGMSRACGALDWGEVIEELKKELNTDKENYLEVAQEYENRFGRNGLIEKLQLLCQLKERNSETLKNHLRILAMNPPLIYTTNYDNAIEEAGRLLLKDYYKIINLKEIVDAPHGSKQIIKFHGDLSSPDSIVFTRNDYDKRLKIEKHPLDVLFRSHILGKSVLFLGYGFGDENIELIFNTHKELYGSANIPRSYIISFEHNPEKEEELMKKNVVTLVLNSPDELSELINKISAEVFDKNIKSQFDRMFDPMPTEVLTNFEINQLRDFINSENKTPQQKHEKFRATIEGKAIALDDESNLALLFEEVIKGNYPDELKEAIIFSFPHTLLRKTENIFKISFDLIFLTENPKFILDFQNMNWTSDVMMSIEHKLGESFGSVESRKILSMIILGYLEGMIAERKKLNFNQVDRLLDTLKNCGYEEFGDLGTGYTPEHIKELLDHYFLEFGNTLKARFESKRLFGRRNTVTEIAEQLMKNTPKNMQ